MIIYPRDPNRRTRSTADSASTGPPPYSQATAGDDQFHGQARYSDSESTASDPNDQFRSGYYQNQEEHYRSPPSPNGRRRGNQRSHGPEISGCDEHTPLNAGASRPPAAMSTSKRTHSVTTKRVLTICVMAIALSFMLRLYTMDTSISSERHQWNLEKAEHVKVRQAWEEEEVRFEERRVEYQDELMVQRERIEYERRERGRQRDAWELEQNDRERNRRDEDQGVRKQREQERETWEAEKETRERKRRGEDQEVRRQREQERKIWEAERETRERKRRDEDQEVRRQREQERKIWEAERETQERKRRDEDQEVRRQREQERKIWEAERKTWEKERHEHDEERRREREAEEQQRRGKQREEEEKHQRDEQKRREEEERTRLGLYWDELQGDSHCYSFGTREYAARLKNLPTTYDGMNGCWNTPITIHDVTVDHPYRCENRGFFDGIFGYFLVKSGETDCQPYWGAFDDKGCVAEGSHTRRIESRLWNIPSGDDWNRMCSTTPADFRGLHFEGPRYCDDKGIWGVYGVWEVVDLQC